MNRKTKTLLWKRINSPTPKWVGELVEPQTIVRFEILQQKEEDKYFIQSNLEGVRKLVTRGFYNSQEIAQSLFESYANSLFTHEPTDTGNE